MTTQQYINIIGLTFDIIGVLLLFKYGLPAEVNKDGAIFFIAEDNDPNEIKKYKKYNFMSKLGLTLIILGFIFQLISTIYHSIINTL